MTYLAALADFSRVATGGLMAAVWQGLLLAAAVGLGLKLLPKTPAAVRFAIWFAVFVVVTGLPLASLWQHATGGTQAGGREPWLTLDLRWSLVIAAVWVVASLVRAGTLVVAAVQVRTLWKRARPVERERASGIHPTHRESAAMDGAPMILEGSSGALPGSRRAQICTSDEVDRPTVIGFFSPKILIPTWLLKKLTAAELKQIVLHETGHLGRADDWMNLLQKIVLVLFPLNPALAWVERRLCFERELACDERVLRTTQAPKAYAACLAALAEHRIGRRGLALALGALGRESELGRRVGRILRRGETMRPMQAKLVLGGAMLGLIGGAVGLERCPQVIGFAATPAQSAALVAQRQVKGGLRGNDGIAYEAVVFHSSVVPSHRRASSIDAGRVSVVNRANGGPRVCANTPPCAIKLREDGAPGLVATAPETNKNGPRRLVAPSATTVHWVVVTTAWQSEDGSRLVLTTARTSPGLPRILSDVAAGADDARALLKPEQSSEEVYPYAAVPVRGGWLVFQL